MKTLPTMEELDLLEAIQNEGEAAILAEQKKYRRKEITRIELRRRVRILAGQTLEKLYAVFPDMGEPERDEPDNDAMAQAWRPVSNLMEVLVSAYGELSRIRRRLPPATPDEKVARASLLAERTVGTIAVMVQERKRGEGWHARERLS